MCNVFSDFRISVISGISKMLYFLVNILAKVPVIKLL